MDNTVAGLGNMGVTLVGTTQSLGDVGGGLVPYDGGRCVLGTVVPLLAVGMSHSAC